MNVNYNMIILTVSLKKGKSSTEIISRNCRHACIPMFMTVV